MNHIADPEHVKAAEKLETYIIRTINQKTLLILEHINGERLRKLIKQLSMNRL